MKSNFYRVSLFLFLFLVLSTPVLLPWVCQSAEDGFLVPDQVVFPSNAVAIPWWGRLDGCADQDYPEGVPLEGLPKSLFSVKRMMNGVYEDIDFTVRKIGNVEPGYPHFMTFNNLLLVEPEEIAVGEKFLVIYDSSLRDDCKYLQSLRQEVEVEIVNDSFNPHGEEAQVLKGDLLMKNKRLIDHGNQSSLRRIAAVSVELVSPEVEKWGDALLISTYVDGELWRPQSDACKDIAPGDSWVCKGKELIYVECDDLGLPEEWYEGVDLKRMTPGVHEVTMVANLPGTEYSISAATQVSVSCD